MDKNGELKEGQTPCCCCGAPSTQLRRGSAYCTRCATASPEELPTTIEKSARAVEEFFQD